jgi:hypothetical protein
MGPITGRVEQGPRHAYSLTSKNLWGIANLTKNFFEKEISATKTGGVEVRFLGRSCRSPL